MLLARCPDARCRAAACGRAPAARRVWGRADLRIFVLPAERFFRKPQARPRSPVAGSNGALSSATPRAPHAGPIAEYPALAAAVPRVAAEMRPVAAVFY